MGCSICCPSWKNNSEEYAKLQDHKHPKYTLSTPSIKRKIRALTKDNMFLLQIGLLGDIEIYEKRCWILRLLDDDEFDVETQTKTETLRNNQISQCNKNIQLNNETYCAQIQLINDMVFMEDNNEDDDIIIGSDDFDVGKFNAFLLCYNITNLHSFNKLREYLDKINSFPDSDTLQIGIMGIIPSCDIDDQSKNKKITEKEAKQLCTEYNATNIQYFGETNAKKGENVSDLVKHVIQKCVDTQSTQ
eukprot:519913_1